MADADTVGRHVRIEFRRDRRLTQDAESVKPRPEPTPTPVAGTLHENFGKVTEKARAILAEMTRLAIVRSIPVPEDAQEVRLAIQRQEPESDGSRITFDLYQRALRSLRAPARLITPDLVDGLTGDLLTDRRRLIQELQRRSGDSSEELIKLLGSQVVILFMLKLLQMGLDNIDTGKQTATKAPFGTEGIVIAASLALSIAAQQAYAGMQEKEIEDALKQLGGTLPKVDLTAAKKQLGALPLFQAAMLERKPGDFIIIAQFSTTYLSRQTDPGWEPWQLADDLELQAEQAEDLADLIEPYVATPTLDPASLITATKRPVALEGLTASLYTRTLSGINSTVDKVANVIGYEPTLDDICCFLNWAGTFDSSTLKAMQHLLKVPHQIAGQLAKQISAANVQLRTNFTFRLQQQIMLLLQDLQQRVLEKFRQWLQTSPERWEELNRCRLIEIFQEYAISALESLDALLVSKLEGLLSTLEQQERQLNDKLDAVGQQKHLRQLFAGLDLITNFSRSVAGFCPTDDPAQLAEAATRIQNKLGPQISLPSDGNDPYSTVQSPPFRLANGLSLPSTPQTNNANAFQAAVDVCQEAHIQHNLVPFPTNDN